MNYDEAIEKFPAAAALDNDGRFGVFLLIELLNGRGEFWKELLEAHDTRGVPFDLIYLELRERPNDPVPKSFTAEMFCNGMSKARGVLYAN